MSNHDVLPGLEQATQALRRVFGGFSPEATEGEVPDRHGWVTKKYEVPRRDVPIPELARFALEMIGCHPFGPGEKLAWGVTFTAGDARCTLTLEKFGVRLYISVPNGPRSDADIETTKQMVLKKLQNAAKVLEKYILTPYSAQQVRAGNVTIENQHHLLRTTYEYFRESTQLAFEGKGRLQGNNYFRPGHREGFYNLVAALNAYMSLLEHTMVLILPFLDFDPETENLAKFISSRWGLKFQRLFNINVDKEAKKHFDQLHKVNEEWRNTYSHGGFDKQQATIHFHVPRVGAVPAALSDVRDSPHFNFFPADAEDFTRVMDILDKLDTWLRSGPASFGLQWAESGLPVRYDAEFREEVARAMRSAETFEYFLEYHGMMHDRATNMDY